MALDTQDRVHLERALSLAEEARGRTTPNPLVGAVIVKEGRILGEGYHEGPWRDHAEIAAMKDALAHASTPPTSSPACTVPAGAYREACEGATLYVTLEPCCTYGRTPPCTAALIEAGFSRVVVGALDPSPSVNGRGIALLREAGVQVDLADDELAHRVRRQNDGMRKAVTTGLPFVTYKYAVTADGRVATDSGDSRWISSEESRALVHRWRSWSDAVMVGAGTVARDDPTLTARLTGGALSARQPEQRQPLRVIVGDAPELGQRSSLRQSLAEGPVLVICGPLVDAARRKELESFGFETAGVAGDSGGRPDPEECARLLAARGIQTVLLEGGPRLAGAWWAAGLIDKVAAFFCPCVVSGWQNRSPLQGSGPASIAEGIPLLEVSWQPVGPDMLLTGYRRGPF